MKKYFFVYPGAPKGVESSVAQLAESDEEIVAEAAKFMGDLTYAPDRLIVIEKSGAETLPDHLRVVVELRAENKRVVNVVK